MPLQFPFFVMFEKVFINENRGVQRLIQSMSDIPRKLFLQTHSHNCVNKLFSSPINKDSQKHNHVFFNFMSFLFFLTSPKCLFSECAVITCLQCHLYKGRTSVWASVTIPRVSCQTAICSNQLKKSCHICVCGMSLECRKKAGKCILYKVCHCKFLTLIFKFLLKEKQLELKVGRLGNKVLKREDETDKKKEASTFS